MLKKFALGSIVSFASHFGRITGTGRNRSTGDDGDEGSQSWDEGEEPHDLGLGREGVWGF